MAKCLIVVSFWIIQVPLESSISKLRKLLFMGDLNVEGHNGFLKEFCDLYNLKNLIKVPTCFKNPDFPTSIDVMFTTSYRSFHNSCAIETGLSDFHKMIVTVMKTNFQKKEPKKNQYRDYNIFLQRSIVNIF